MKVVLASKNKHKLAEISRITEKFDMELILQSELGIDLDVEENGTTFEENSLIKAEAVMKATGLPALADDSGIAVDALNGAPGIYSARFAGEQRSDADNNAKVLQLLEGVEDSNRTARFFCVIAIVLPDGREYTVEGTCEGTILHALRGEGGFGYDSLFYVESLDKTFAELTMEEKNRISHRGHANRKAVEIIRGLKSE